MPRYFEFEVSLTGVKPKIWRRFLLKGSGTFLDLHRAIQDACGWADYHLYNFLDPQGKRTLARAPYEDPFDEEDAPTANKVKLASHFARKGAKCVYVYDYGDDWHHLVVLKRAAELPDRFTRRLVDGARAFPPEDCGGLWGYGDCLKAVGVLAPDKDDDLSDLEDRKTWLGDWDPERFDLKATKKEFDR
jgi:hypothetical protein